MNSRMQSSEPSLRQLLNRPVHSGREYTLRVVAALAILAGIAWYLHGHPARSSLKDTRQCLVANGFHVKRVGPQTLQVDGDLQLTFKPTIAAAKETGLPRKRNVVYRGDLSDFVERCLDRAAE
jgi:hypothetical protein